MRICLGMCTCIYADVYTVHPYRPAQGRKVPLIYPLLHLSIGYVDWNSKTGGRRAQAVFAEGRTKDRIFLLTPWGAPRAGVLWRKTQEVVLWLSICTYLLPALHILEGG